MKWVSLIAFLLCFWRGSALAGVLSFTSYHSPAQVDAALTTLNSTYPTLTQISTIGTSVQGAPIKALKISDNPGTDDPNEGDVVFVAMHHAREWISVEMALYLADELLARYSTDPELQADINDLEIWIIPVVNPDGFAHTWDPSGYRYWRKNRRNNGDGTFGVDLNRNWGFQWGLVSGSSNVTSDETYHGTGPFSEPEILALRNFLQGLHNLKCFVTYHSFSELFLRPWSYTLTDAPGESTLRSLVLRSIDRIAAVHGHIYGETIWYTSSGEATDYVWEEMHRAAAFTPELRPASGGLAGFSPPASTILPNNEENLPAALALIHDAARTGLWIRDYAGDTGAEPSAVWTGSNWSQAFWVSPDIWTVPAVLNQGATVDLKVKVHNNTGAAQNNVTIDVYYTDPRISLEFPNPDAVLIGTRTISVPVAGATITIPWTVPIGTNSWGELHWCVGAVVKHDRDLPLTTQVNRSSNLGCRNFNTTTVVESGIVVIAAQNFLDVAAELLIKIDDDSLPRGWQITMPVPQELPVQRRAARASTRKAQLLNAKGIILEPGQTIYLPIKIDRSRAVVAGAAFDVNVHGALLPLVAGKREAVGNGYTYRVVAARR